MQKTVEICPGLLLAQDDRFFPLGQDSVLLASFAAGRARGRGLDLGAGQGFLAVLTALRAPGLQLEGLELSAEAASLAAENGSRAGLNFPVRCADLREFPVDLHGKYDFCLCNPPYYEAARGKTARESALAQARCDEGASAAQFCRAAFLALKTGGRLFLCFPAGRLESLFAALRENRLAPKRLRFVHPRPEKEAQLALLEAVKQGGEGLCVLPPLILREASGTFSAEYLRIYGELSPRNPG